MSQISYIKYKDVIEAWRFDAEYFKPNLLEMISNLEKKWCFVLWENAQIKWWKRLPLWEDFSDEWIPYIRAEDIKNWFVDYENSPKISEELHKKLINYQTKKDDNLITIVWNSVWDVWIVKFDLDKCNLTENACKIINLNLINPDSFFAFMLSSYWQNQIHREKVWTAQPKLALERIRRFRIPKFKDNIQQEISEIVESAYDKKKKSKQLYQEAEDLLLTELWLKNHIISHTLTFSTTKKAVDEAWRYDADYFQPKYDELIGKIENYKWGWDYVENLFKQNLSVAKTDSEICNYVEIWDINISNWEIIPNEIFVSDLPANWKRVLKKNDLLISKVRPYRWAVSFIDFECGNLIWSWAFTILQEKTDYKKEVLMVFLKTECIKDLLLRYNCGTSYPVIKDETILKLKLPLINPQLQKEISDRIKDSFRLRNESKELLEQAKKMVEEEIEKQ